MKITRKMLVRKTKLLKAMAGGEGEGLQQQEEILM